MWEIRLLVWIIIGITTVNTRRNMPSELLSSTELVITAFQSLSDVTIDGQPVQLTNASNWKLTDRIALPPMSRLIAFKGLLTIDSPCAGVLASVNDTYLVTSNLWKCSPYNDLNWEQLGFDDLSWPSAVEYGSNGDHVTCTEQMYFTDISSTAQWIWSDFPNDFFAFCRGYLPLCQTASPCLNGGTCLQNHKKMCDCTPEFTGTYCESSLITTATTATISIAETTLSSTSGALSTTSSSTTETTSKSPTTSTVITPVVSTARTTTNLPSTTTTTSQPPSSTTTVTTKVNTPLVITVYKLLLTLYIDGIQQPLINGNISNQPDRVELTETNRLIAVKAAGDRTCGGLLASIGDSYVLTDGKWKCDGDTYKDWERPGFNDSKWKFAVEFGSNADGHTGCSQPQFIPDISADAKWIWVSDQTEYEIYCRGYIPVCDNSPCQNNGTCQQNNKTMCRCTPQFTGTYCETEILASTTKMTMETTTQEQTTKGISTNNLQTTEVTTQPQTTEVTTQTQTLKVTTQPQTTEVTTQPQTTELTTQTQTTKVTTQPQTTKVTTQPQTTKVTTQPQTTKVTTQPQTSEVTTQPQTTEVTTQPQTSEVTTRLQTTEVKTHFQTTEGITSNNPETTEVTLEPQTTKGITTDSRWTTELTTQPQATDGISTANRQTTQKTTVMVTTQGITTDTLQTTDPPTTDAAATSAITTTATTATTSIAETTLNSANGVPSTSPSTTASTTASITHPQTTEAITTINRQTTMETTLAETTRSITTDSLQTTDPPTTEAVATTATTPATTATTSIAETTLTSTSGASSTASSTTETTSKSSSTSTVTTPVVSTTRPTTNLPSTTTTTAWVNPGDQVSTDPPDLPICTTDDYCNGPFEKHGASIVDCACPADFLNVNNNCCMSQNWIIGLTCLCVAILLLLFIIIIVCICQSDDSHSSIGDSMSLVDSDRLGDDGHSMDVSIVSETKIKSHKKPGVVDAHGVKDDVLQASADGHFEAEKSRDGQEIRRRSRELVGPGSNTLRGLNPSGLHPLTQQPIYTLGRRRGQPEYRSMIEGGRREDFFYNPLMVEMLSNDIYRRFRPNMSAIPTNVDYSIQRPEIELEFLYNELYGSELPPGMYDYNSPWNMNMRP